MQSQSINPRWIIATAVCVVLGYILLCSSYENRSGPLCDHGDIKGIDVSRNATLIAVAGRYGRSNDGRLSIYDEQTGQELTNHAWPDSKLLDVAFDKIEEWRLATISGDGKLIIWQIIMAGDGKPIGLRVISQLGMPSPGSNVAFSPVENVLVVTCSDHIVRIVDTTTTVRLVKELAGHTAEPTAVAFSANGRFVASAGGADGTVRIWDTQNWQLIRSLTSDIQHVFITDVTFSSDNNHLLASYGKPHVRSREAISKGPITGGHVRIWDVRNGDTKALFYVGGDKVTSVCLSPHDDVLLAGYAHDSARTSDHAVAIVDRSSGERISTLRGPWREPIAHWYGSNKVVVVDGRFISCWDVTMPKEPKRLWGTEWSWRDNLLRSGGLGTATTPAG